MSEPDRYPTEDPTRELSSVIAELGIGIVRESDFMGQKVAREFLDELGLPNALGDEVGDTALVDVMGTCVTGGIVIGMKKKTDQASVQKEVQRLQDQLPLPLRSSVGRLVPYLVPRGIEFYEQELSQNSPKVQEWTREFQLLRSAELS